MVGSAADRLLEIELRDFGWLQYGGRATADRGRRNLAWMSGQGGPGRSGRHFRFGGLLEAARLAGSDPTKIASRPPRLALLWQILSGTGFPNHFFCDSWVVGFWRG